MSDQPYDDLRPRYSMKRMRDELALAKKQARREALEEAARLIEEGFDRGIAKKQDTCAHGKFEWEDCEICAAAAIRELAEEKER